MDWDAEGFLGSARQQHWEFSCRVYMERPTHWEIHGAARQQHWESGCRVYGWRGIRHWASVIGDLSFGHLSLGICHWASVIWNSVMDEEARREGVSEELICIKSNNPTLKGGELCGIQSYYRSA